jgi:mRNA-degrading endonuclease RelE of RelBE toxin-antitoxin system
MYEVCISREVEKYYKKLDKRSKERINNSISSISKEPLSGVHIKKLWGKLEGKHRYAIGSLRIVYEVDTKNKIVKIKAIRSRGDVYKKL